MTQIWKYPLNALVQPTRVSIPKSAEILCVQIQHNQPVIWAKVETYSERETRFFWIFGTGHTIPSKLELKYISTFQLEDGALVFHVFEQI